MGALAARKGNWTVFGDLIYLDAGNKATVPVNLGGGVVPVTASLDRTGGARFLWLDSHVAVTVSPQPTITRTDIGSNWDAVVGFRGKTDLNDKWYLTYYMDVGAGQSNSTWQALGAVNYRLGEADLTFGYRYLDWNLGKFGPFKDLNLSGVFAGVKVPF